jgi:hypothetical protein
MQRFDPRAWNGGKHEGALVVQEAYTAVLPGLESC